MPTTNLRRLRTKYSIPLRALAGKLGVSTQFLSYLELGAIQAYDSYEEKLLYAVEKLITESREALSDMEQEFAAYNGKLLQESEVPDEC